MAELVRRLRLEAAHRMLSDRTDGRSLRQIAHAAGLPNEARFSQQFHDVFGYTASALHRSGDVSSALPPDAEDVPQTYSRAVNRVAFGPDGV